MRRKDSEIESGLIFNIQKFSVHDGPGIRTTVFMKGCPLDCLWCSNPESKNFSPELVARDINCRGCGLCLQACTRSAIALTEENGRKIDRKKCDNCLACVGSCRFGALGRCGTRMSVEETIVEIRKDQIFYVNSGGGVTVSGGEPLGQGRFVRALLEQCRTEGLHTALETCGHAPWEVLEKVLPLVDLTLFDIKHLDADRHLEGTGKRNDLILKNVRRISPLSGLWLRIPLIAGFNDSEEHIGRIASFGLEVGASKISLLPYHEGGRSKSAQLGTEYGFSEGKAPEDAHVKKLKRLIESRGLPADIGL